MSYRGRLIFPLLGEIRRLDLVATGTTPVSGYDPVYREILKAPSGDRLGASLRQEMAAVYVPLQFEPASLQKLQMIGSGDASSGRFVCIAHFMDLAALGLVDGTSGIALIRKGDRLNSVKRLDGTLEQTIPPPGLYVTEALPIFGLGNARNLLQITLESRDPGR